MTLLEDTANISWVIITEQISTKNTNMQSPKTQKYAEYLRYLSFVPDIFQPSLQLPSLVGIIDVQWVV